MPKVTVADTSCLILFHKIGETDLLKKLFEQLSVTKAVADEFNKPLPEWIKVVKANSNESKALSSILDIGEATSISLALNHSNSLLIIDEVKGRKVAKEMGIRVTGSLGVLVTAKDKGYIKAVKPITDKVQQTNFRISDDLIRVVLQKAGEG